MAEMKVETTPSGKKRSRWDLTPAQTPSNGLAGATPSYTPMHDGDATPMLTPGGSTPVGAAAMAMKTPAVGYVPMTPEQAVIYKWERELDTRNQQITDEELDALFPPGYRVLQPPAGYNPIRTPARKLFATPTPMSGNATSGFMIPQTPERGGAGEKTGAGGIMDTQPKDKDLPALKPEDIQYFEKLLEDVDESTLTKGERNDREIMGYVSCSLNQPSVCD